ncbi:MAG: iron complex outermembrane receptor protein [Halieaceae bacterium]|jgi:iron complex outermembrane receptor protein
MLRKPSQRTSMIIGLAAAASVFNSPALQAQEKQMLEEILVTAQRRSENIQEVPISITSMSGDRLAARFANGDDILALSSAAPGLYIESSNGRLAPRFYLRGLGNADFTAAASQPVSLVMDDVPMEKSVLKAFPLFDMASVEVIRGPQGTLFGRNTTAGIVKIDSRRPTDETEGYINASAGNYGIYNLEGAIGGTIIDDTLTGRVSAVSQNRSDWVDNDFTGESDALGGYDIAAARFQLQWTPSDDLTFWLMHQRQDSESTTSLFRANILSKGSNKLNSNFDRDSVSYDGGDGNEGGMKSNGTTLKIDWEIGDYTLTSITSYQDVTDRYGRGDIDGGFGCLFTCSGPSGPASIPFNPDASPFVVNVDTGGSIELEQLTQEIRLASNFNGRFNYQVGVFYFEDDFSGTAENQSAGAAEFLIGSTAAIENTTYAVFGQGSYDLSDRLTVTAGVRYTDDEKDSVNVRYENGVPSEVLPEINLEDDNISWDLALSFAATEESQIYGRIASGFRAPTIQDRLEDDPEVTTADSETIMSYEMGYKAQYARLRYNAAAFYYVIDDIQLTAVGGTSNSTTLLNGDEGTGYGVEFEIEYILLDNLTLSGGFGYVKTEINDSTLAIPGGALTTVTDPLNAEGLALIDGNPFQHAPEWTANLEIDYVYPISGGSAEIYAFSDWKFRGETNDFLYENIEYTTDTQFEGGLRFGYRNLSNNYQLGFFARNITDEENIIGGIDFANLLAYTNEPRTYGVEASWNF